MKMKNKIKNTLLVIAMLTSSYALAQDKTFNSNKELQVGDSVMIRQSEVTRYLTGEEPSKWVYGKKFEVGQLGGKRFPEGVLLKPIISWIGPDDVFYILLF